MKTLDFLQKWSADGPWVLTAIHPDRKSIETKTFDLATASDMAKWIADYDGDRNLYFHVNPTKGPLTKKAERADISALAWLHVDIDPRVGEDIEEERKRALGLLQAPPAGIPAPTCIVFSGGGYQAFWRLSDSLPTPDLAAAELAARYNIQLEVLLGADNCHNIDRIMRLPGTMNLPDAKKRAKGRMAIRAEVVSFSDVEYPLTDFTPAPGKQVVTDAGSWDAVPALDTGNVERLSSVEDLPESVHDRTKVIIVQGCDPDEPNKYPSRSEWLFSVVCDLVRAEVPDEIIYSVITDPGFGISASVIDKGSRTEKYALHQIQRAKEQVENPYLRELNERFAVIGNMGGKCRIVEETADHALGGRTRVTKQSFEDFRNRFSNKKIQIGVNAKGQPTYMPLGVWWLAHEQRKQFESIVFSPGEEVPGSFNLWRGFACDAIPGDCGLLLGHIFENVCNGNEAHYNYLLGWLATAVQFPARPGETAIVLRGRKGTGKSFFVKAFGSLWGRHFLQVSNANHIVGNFNAHLRDCVVLFGDEAFYAGDKKHESVLKTLVTEETTVYEMKGVDSEVGPNFTHIFLASNSAWVVPASGDERRFFVLDVSDGRMQNSVYFANIQAQMDNGGREALLHMLLTYPLPGYNVRSVPKTDALSDQKVHSLSPEEEWWYNKLCDGRVFSGLDEWPTSVTRTELFDDYASHMQKIGRNFRASPTVIGRFLHRVTPRNKMRVHHPTVDIDDGWSGGTRSRTMPSYVLPTLEECRDFWVNTFGSFGDW